MDDRRDEPISVPRAARLLGIEPHTLYRLMEEGRLGTVRTYRPRANGRPERRRSFELTHGDIADFLDRSRVSPGALAHLRGQPPRRPMSTSS